VDGTRGVDAKQRSHAEGSAVGGHLQVAFEIGPVNDQSRLPGERRQGDARGMAVVVVDTDRYQGSRGARELEELRGRPRT
jgi:hypothetical protein